MDRLVLGCGALGTRLVERLVDMPGSLLVLVADEQRAESFRDEGVDARRVTIDDPTVVRTVAGEVDTVVVAPPQLIPAETAELAAVARTAYPEAFILACQSRDRLATDDTRVGGGTADTNGSADTNGTADTDDKADADDADDTADADDADDADGADDTADTDSAADAADSDGHGRANAAEHADRVLDVADETAARLLERVGDAGIRPRRLQRVLRDVDGTLAVIAHDNPDPDAIASAVGLKHVAETAGTDAEVCYFGEISHQENRAMVNLLEFDLRNLDDDADLSSFGGFALVDHSRPGINNGLPEDTPIDVVIDHHPPRAPVEARFVDLRSDVGATSTLLVEYLDRLDLALSDDLATGLLFGIRTDTREFRREVSPTDFDAAARLIDHVDQEALGRIETPSLTAETLEVLARAVTNRRVEGGVLTSCVGRIGDRDALAQASDRLLELEDINTTMVFGYTDETVFISARARSAGTEVDLGEVLRDAFEQIGNAGGHANMAGAQIPLGILLEETDEEERRTVIEEIITERFFETLGVHPAGVTTLVYDDFIGIGGHGLGGSGSDGSAGDGDGGGDGADERNRSADQNGDDQPGDDQTGDGQTGDGQTRDDQTRDDQTSDEG